MKPEALGRTNIKDLIRENALNIRKMKPYGEVLYEEDH